ncbi:hypothetical protein F5Y08DRAFT_314766 [Xylaria arbuscula]|nr:hypothetical protein F5Y08DRAFT_314766 [Xylaria arbuscula]
MGETIVTAYEDGFTQFAFYIDNLPRSENFSTIEYAIRRHLIDQETVAVFWPFSWYVLPNCKHHGWCHVMCQTVASKRRLMRALDGVKLYPECPKPCKAMNIEFCLEEFQRIRHIASLKSLPLRIKDIAPIQSPVSVAALIDDEGATTR